MKKFLAVLLLALLVSVVPAVAQGATDVMVITPEGVQLGQEIGSVATATIKEATPQKVGAVTDVGTPTVVPGYLYFRGSNSVEGGASTEVNLRLALSPKLRGNKYTVEMGVLRLAGIVSLPDVNEQATPREYRCRYPWPLEIGAEVSLHLANSQTDGRPFCQIANQTPLEQGYWQLDVVLTKEGASDPSLIAYTTILVGKPARADAQYAWGLFRGVEPHRIAAFPTESKTLIRFSGLVASNTSGLPFDQYVMVVGQYNPLPITPLVLANTPFVDGLVEIPNLASGNSQLAIVYPFKDSPRVVSWTMGIVHAVPVPFLPRR